MEIESLIWLENVKIFFILAYFWVEKELMFVEIVCDPFKKSFFSVGKQTKPSDYF